MSTTRDQWKEAMAERDRARASLLSAQECVKSRFRQLVTEELRVAPGSIVRVGDAHYLVGSIEVHDNDPQKLQPWLRGRKLKKDGTPGGRDTTIYRGWTLVEIER